MHGRRLAGPTGPKTARLRLDAPGTLDGMWAVLETDIRRFADTTLAWVHRKPVINNVLATEAERVLAGRRRYNDALWLTVRADAAGASYDADDPDAGEVVGAAMHTPPFRLFICPMRDDAARVLAHALVGDHSFRARRACQPTIA